MPHPRELRGRMPGFLAGGARPLSPEARDLLLRRRKAAKPAKAPQADTMPAERRTRPAQQAERGQAAASAAPTSRLTGRENALSRVPESAPAHGLRGTRPQRPSVDEAGPGAPRPAMPPQARVPEQARSRMKQHYR